MKIGEQTVLCTSESLGVILYCEFCDVAICEWDSSSRRWLVGPDDPDSLVQPDEDGKVACWNCLRERVDLPDKTAVDRVLCSCVKEVGDEPCCVHDVADWRYNV